MMMLEKGVCPGEWDLKGGRHLRGGPYLASWAGNGNETLFLGQSCPMSKKDSAAFKDL